METVDDTEGKTKHLVYLYYYNKILQTGLGY